MLPSSDSCAHHGKMSRKVYRIVVGDMSGSLVKIFFWLSGKVASISGN